MTIHLNRSASRLLLLSLLLLAAGCPVTTNSAEACRKACHPRAVERLSYFDCVCAPKEAK